MLLKAQDACWQQLRELRLINKNVESFVDKEMSLELLRPSRTERYTTSSVWNFFNIPQWLRQELGQLHENIRCALSQSYFMNKPKITARAEKQYSLRNLEIKRRSLFANSCKVDEFSMRLRVVGIFIVLTRLYQYVRHIYTGSYKDTSKWKLSWILLRFIAFSNSRTLLELSKPRDCFLIACPSPPLHPKAR